MIKNTFVAFNKYQLGNEVRKTEKYGEKEEGEEINIETEGRDSGREA